SRVEKDMKNRKEKGIPTKPSKFVQPIIPSENIEKQKDMANYNHKLQLKMQKESNTGGDGAPNSSPNKPKERPGRPPGSKDTVTRNKRVGSRGSIDSMMMALSIQDKLDSIVDDAFMVY